jgi:hypothetical protein
MATVNAAESLNDLHEKWIKPSLYARRDFNRPSQVIITQKFTIPAANLIANDIVRLFKFPAAAFLLDWRSTPSDMDTDGTPALTYSILTTSDADATLLTIVSGSTNGQAAAGSDRMISAVAGRYVGNSWCVWKTGTAADVAAAGTLKVYCAFALGTINRLSRGLYLRDPEL